MTHHTLIILVSLSCVQLVRTSEPPPTRGNQASRQEDSPSCSGSDGLCKSDDCGNAKREGCRAAGTEVTRNIGRIRRENAQHAGRKMREHRHDCPLNYTVYISTGCHPNVECNGLIVSIDWILTASHCIPEDRLKEYKVTAGYDKSMQHAISQTVSVNDSKRINQRSLYALYRLYREEAAPTGGFLVHECLKGWLFQIYNQTIDSLVNIFWFYGEEPYVYAYVKPEKPFRVQSEKECALNFALYKPEDHFCVLPYTKSDPVARAGAPVLVNHGTDLRDARIIGIVVKVDNPSRSHLIAKMTSKLITWLQNAIE